MQNKTFTILFNILFCISLGQSRSLPDEMRIAEDGKRLMLGGNASEGFYDERTIRTIDFHFDQSNYWDMLSSNYDTGTDLMATITIGLFSASIPGYSAGTYVRYYVEAMASNTAKTATFMPKGAEQDVYFFRVSSDNSNTESEVVINEFLASNDAVVADQDGEFDDWIELYNTSEEAIDLSGYFLSDNPENLDKYEIPAGTIIPANDYLIIWADEDGSQEGLHANFKLGASGEEIYFLDPEVNILDQVIFGAQTTDMSYARMPNGYGDFTVASPTFKANNDGTTDTDDVLERNASLSIYPNPASSEVIIAFDELSQPIKTLKLFDVFGRLLESHQSNLSTTQLRTEHLANGVYFVIINDTLTRSLIIEK